MIIERDRGCGMCGSGYNGTGSGWVAVFIHFDTIFMSKG
jgi:hypothetical protein